MPVNVYSVDELIAAFVALTSGAQYGDLISSPAQGTGFLPDSEVRWNRQVLHDNEDLLRHNKPSL
jgi:hypothetical protein